jgi:iron complex transport system ATP-binding protein
MSQLAFEVGGLSASLGRGRFSSKILNNIDLQIQQGQWTSIVGPNGAGKSTLLKCLANFLPFHGKVKLNGKALSDWSSRERALQISWLGQNEHVTQELRVWDVVMLGRLPHQAWLASANSMDELAVKEALELTQSSDWINRSIGELSAGERQRVLLARALAVQAQVLLMDEPLMNLDPPHQVDWLHLVRHLVNQGKTVISVLHELPMALQSDELIVMRDGQIMHHGTSGNAQTHQAVEQVFDDCIEIVSVRGQWVSLARER